MVVSITVLLSICLLVAVAGEKYTLDKSGGAVVNAVTCCGG